MFLHATVLLSAIGAVNGRALTALSDSNSALPASLQTCLSGTGASLVHPNDGTYTGLTTAQNTNYHPHPEVIAVPTSSQQVASVVRCVAAQNGGVKVSPRGGGHSYAAYGLSGQVVVDSSQMQGITIDDAKRQATVQFGVKLGNMATTLGQRGYALPHGTCPAVGVAGHSLGGGWGFSSRKWGWLLDHIVSMEFVDVTGKIKTLTPQSTGADADLWWALRGAGSNNFGIVTSFTFALETAPTAIVNYGVRYSSRSDCVQVLLALQKLGGLSATDPNGFPVELGGEFLIYGDGTCQFTGQFLGSRAGYNTVMGRLNAELSRGGVTTANAPGSYARDFNNWVSALTDLMGSLSASSVTLGYYAKSFIDNGHPNYSAADANAIINAVINANGADGLGTSISFEMNGPGSKTNSLPTHGAASFTHRLSLFQSQIYSTPFPGFGDTAGRADALQRVNGITETLKKNAPKGDWHAYQNYIDPDLQSWGRAYYSTNLDRLKSLKSSLDPHTIFDFPQGLAHA